MIILGIDPGTKFTGYGIIVFRNNELTYIDSGIIEPPKTASLAEKLEKIYDEIEKLIKKYRPTEFSLETAFYGKNVQSVMKIGYVRGISLLVSAHNGLDPAQYSPREIKKAVVGNGGASKEQVQFMIKKLLGLKKEKMKTDESDALATAICHAFKKTSPVKKSKNWAGFVKENPDKVIE